MDATALWRNPYSHGAKGSDAAGRRILLANFTSSGSNRAIRVHDIARGVTSRVRRGVGGWVAWGPGPDDYTFAEQTEGRVGWATIGDTADPFMLDLPPGIVGILVVEWSPDRRHLLCIGRELGKAYDLLAWSKDDGWVNLTNTPDVWELWPTFSPDGRWIAYVTDSRVHVRPFLRAGSAIQVSTTKSSQPLWSPDGKELYYRSEEEAPVANTTGGTSGSTETQRWAMAAPVTVTESGIDIGRSERLFRADGYASITPIRSWDIAPDGRFLMSVRDSEEAIRSAIDDFFPKRIRLIQNWTSTLEEQRP